MAYGVLLLGLAIFKGAEFWRMNGFHGSRLVIILVRDQAMYFALQVVLLSNYSKALSLHFRAIFVTVFALLGDLLEENNTVTTGVIITLGSPTLLCVLGSRMFFNLQEAAEHGVNIGTNWSSHSHTTMRFGEAWDGDNQSVIPWLSIFSS